MIMCHCGKLIHYTDKKIERYVLDTCKANGEYVNVTSTATGKTYRVQRHYIALHGIKEDLLDSYGFVEIENATKESMVIGNTDIEEDIVHVVCPPAEKIIKPNLGSIKSTCNCCGIEVWVCVESQKEIEAAPSIHKIVCMECAFKMATQLDEVNLEVIDDKKIIH
jgi:hypothetical protein